MSQDRDWARGVRVSCDDKLVRNFAEIIPSNITSVEDELYCSPKTKHYTHEDWRGMGTALCESRMLTKLKLKGLPKEAAESLFGGNIHWPKLEELRLESGKFGLSGVNRILPLLNPVSTLDILDLSGANLGVTAARLLAEALDNTPIRILYLAKNNITDEGLDRILSAQNAPHLVKLFIQGNRFEDRGFEALSLFFRRDDTELKALSVDTEQKHGNYSDGTTRRTLLIGSISKASKLESMALMDGYWGLDDDTIQDIVLNLVCDTSSFESMAKSNHRFFSLGLTTREHPSLVKAFEINWELSKSGSIANAIRRKLRNFYFIGDYDVQYFNDMDVALMPYLLNLVLFAESDESRSRYFGGDSTRLVPRDSLNAIYRLLRNCHVSEMFSFPSPESRLRSKVEQIDQLKHKRAKLKAEMESMKQKIDQLKEENEELRSTGSPLPNKRARTGDVESRLAALEADVEMLKGSRS